MKPMKIIFITAFAIVAMLWINPANAQSREGQVRVKTSTSAQNTFKSGPPKGTEFWCEGGSKNPSANTCGCLSISDCIALKDSGKCTGDIEESPGQKGGTCPSNGADKPSEGQLKLRAKTQTSKKNALPSTIGGLKAGKPGGNEYWCNYDSNGNKKACGCSGLKDCLELSNSGSCGAWEIDDKGWCKP